MDRDKILAQFKEDSKDHKMTIINDNGLNRHLRFRKENSSFVYGYDIITWSGYLCISGDMGCYVFSRIQDMFEFFGYKENINPGYWGEKLQAISNYVGYKEFSIENFKENIKNDYDLFIEDHEEYEEKKEEIWESIEHDILNHLDDSDESLAIKLACEFEYDKHYIFQDFYEHNCKEYTVHYIWCLYAIVYAIKEYNKVKSGNLINE